ncbi:MAG: PAS domain S-box protein [Agriterribacter sp.]
MLNHLKLQDRLHALSFVLVYIVLIISSAALAGWMLDIEFLKRPFSTDVAMNPLTAILLIISGIASIMLWKGGKAYRYPGLSLAGLVAILALIKLIGLHTQINIHIDHFLLKNKLLQDGLTVDKLSMTVGASICFVLNSAILFLLSSNRVKAFIISQVCIIVLLAIAWFSFIGYLYDVDIFYKLFTYVPMAIHAAVCFLLLALASLFVTPDKGIMQLLTSKYEASITARRLIPIAIILPTLLGFIRLGGYWHQAYTLEFGTAALILSITILFMISIWYNATLLVAREKENEKVQDILRYNDSLLQNISDAIFSTDISLNIRTWNRHAEILYGYAAAEVIGKNLEAVLRTAYPGESFEAIGKHFMEKGSWAGELTQFTKSGDKLNVYISTSLLRDQNNVPTGTVTVVRDISQRRKAEDLLAESELRLQSIIDTYDGPIYAKDKEARYIVWNKACEKTAGYTAMEAIGKSADELFPPAAAKLARERDEEIFALKMPRQFDWEWDVGTQKKLFSIILFPMYNSKGEVYGSCGLAIDITSRKELEKNLREFNTKLEKEVEERTILLRELTEHLNTVRETERMEIAREIHDELGQQMTVLKMDVLMIKRKLPGGDNEIDEKIDEMVDMINQTINTIRRIASQLRPAVLDDMGLTAAMEWQLKDMEKRFNITTLFVHNDIPPVLSEKTKTGMFRILQESLTNVARHSNASRVEATLTYENNKLQLTVKDNGKGFDLDKMTRKTLGILGMKERAAAMNGTYLIESTPGKGTLIKVETAPETGKS